jgi:two-component system OmpR family response regulator
MRALVIEGEQVMRAWLTPFFQKSGLDLYTAASVEDARALIPVLKPVVTIVDRELRDGDGLDLVADALEVGARMMLVSARNDAADRIKALTLGAHDYLAKPADPEEVYLRVRNLIGAQVANRGEPDMVREFGGVKIDLSTRAVLRSDGSPADELTETELAVLRKLAENIDRIVSRESLHPVVTGDEMTDRPTRAIDTCVSRLRIKLGSAQVGVEIRSVRQAGYLFRRERGTR